MHKWHRVLFCVLAAGFSMSFLPDGAVACGGSCDPCLVVYSDGFVYFHYDPDDYYTVTAGDPLYDPAYDRGGEVLIRDYRFRPDEIAYVAYQAPMLGGFEEATSGKTGFYFTGRSFNLVIDGWSRYPKTHDDVVLLFEPDEGCTPSLFVDGASVAGPPYKVELGDLAVTTPTPDGDFYSDTIVLSVLWNGCYGLYMSAFEDCDHDRHWNPCPRHDDEDDEWHCDRTCSFGAVAPTEPRTWGAIKVLYE